MPIQFPAPIYGQVGQGVRSVEDYAALRDLATQRGQAIQQGALGLLTGQQKADEYTRGLKEQEALRSLLGDSAFNRNAPDARARVYQAAPGLADKVFQGWSAQDKSAADVTHLGAQAEQQKAAATKAASENANLVLGQFKQFIPNVQTAQDMEELTKAMYAHPVAGPIMASHAPLEKALAAIPQDPKVLQENLKKWAMGTTDYVKDQTTREGHQMTQDTAIANNTVTNKQSDVNSRRSANTSIAVAGMHEKGANVRAGVDENGVPTGDAQAVAQGIADLQIPPLSASALRSVRGQQIMSQVMKLKPDFQATDYSAKNRTEGTFVAGPEGRTVRALNVVQDHLDTYQKAFDALKNGDIPTINRLGNKIAEMTGKPAPTTAQAVANVLKDELAKGIVGSSMALADRESFGKSVDANSQSPAQNAGVVTAIQDLIAGQHSGLEQQYKAGKGSKNFKEDFLSPASRAAYERKQGMANPSGKATFLGFEK